MSSIEKMIKRNCKQMAVYWAPAGKDVYGGISFNNPVEVKCRWEDKQQLVKDNDGNEILSNAQVFVLKDLQEQGYLFLGRLTDLTNTDPREVNEAWEIKKKDKSPAMDSVRKFVKVVYLG